ncbi:MAG: hypothetical protein HXX09_13485 [Bacteroidetes bacterium]|nr:hypothetical protein [Bacteroidota bacterium]
MKGPKNKYTFLLYGILIGLLVSFSVVWWQNSSGGGDWSLIKKVKTFFSSIFESSDADSNITVKESDKTALYRSLKQKAQKNGKDSLSFFDTTNVDIYDPNAMDEFFASFNGKMPDSLQLDSFFKSQKAYAKVKDDDVVMKDELLFSKTVQASGINPNDKNGKNLDSLLVGDINTKKNSKNIYRVEFWKSPVNYKGYKMGKDKVIIFGLFEFETVSLKLLNKLLYLKSGKDFYTIENTTDFKPLTPISNKSLLNQLNGK